MERKIMQKQEILKQEILQKVKEYYDVLHKEKQNRAFAKGKDQIHYASRVFDESEMLNLVDSSLEFWLTYGRYSKEFETKLSKFLGIRYTLLVNSGSSANLLAFYALTSPLLRERQINRGDEIITVAAGFPTTIAPIVQYGAIPVFVDMELKHFNIDVSQIEQAITNKTKAIMVAHTLGNPFDIQAIKKICEKYNLWLIEDNCDALGSKYKDKYTGTWGDIGTSSFYPPHHLTMGEGGAVYTDNPLLKKILLSMRDWGRDCWCESGVDNTCKHRFTQQFGTLPKGYDHKYVYSHFGFNLKVSDMQAAIGVAQLDKLPSFISKRQQNWQYLYDNLKNTDEFIFVTPQAESEVSWFGFMITLKDNLNFSRNDIVHYLEDNHIQTRNLFAGNIIRHPLFASLNQSIDYKVAANMTNTDKIMNDSFWIGVYPNLSKDMLDYMIDTIKQFISIHS
jgi:CDP-6-deoxy-D-xylo-4-hexulose-3-dehydrase